MWEPPSDPQAAAEMDVALADLAHSNLYGSNFAEDAKLQRVLDIARRLPPTYTPPGRYKMGGTLLTKLYDVNWIKETHSLLKDSHIFGISLFGDGATIKTTPMINALGAGVHNSFAMLEVFDCTDHCATGGKKDASYIANLFLPLISKLENVEDPYVSWRCLIIAIHPSFLTFILLFSIHRETSTLTLLIWFTSTGQVMSRRRRILLP